MHGDQQAVTNMLGQLREAIIGKMASGRKRIMENEGKEVLGSGLEIGDRSSLHITNHLHICHMESCRTVLAQVEDAIRRARGGSYGFCSLCENPIGMGRLRFLPFATHCRDCQEEIEQDKNRPPLRFATGM